MRHTLTLKETRQETSDVRSFVFSSEEKIEYQAGQFFKWYLSHPNPDDRGINRFFTISSAPSEGFIMLTTRFAGEDATSSFKRALFNLKPGERIEVDGPSGKFILEPDNQLLENQTTIFIAGGIGITPFRSILKELHLQKITPQITLIYANKSEGNIPFKEELDLFAQQNPNLKIDYFTGNLTPDILKKFTSNQLPENQITTFYISGPEPMVISTVKILEELGIPKTQIKTDYFPGYKEI